MSLVHISAGCGRNPSKVRGETRQSTSKRQIAQPQIVYASCFCYLSYRYIYIYIYIHTHIHIHIHIHISIYIYLKNKIYIIQYVIFEETSLFRSAQNTLPPLPRWAFPCTPMPVVRAMPPATALLAFHTLS